MSDPLWKKSLGQSMYHRIKGEEKRTKFEVSSQKIGPEILDVSLILKCSNNKL